MKRILLISLALASITSFADIKTGQKIFKQNCANCHGDKGQGLIGPNLTDKEVLHGSSKAEIEKVIKEGVLAKAMPAWISILTEQQISDTADYIKSIMGKNLKDGFVKVQSTVNSFPRGSLEKPYLIRTYMPVNGLSDDIFPNHGKGTEAPKYNPRNGKEDPQKMIKPINGLPATITVNFGPELSYTFDTIECRLLYTWKGDFLDMTKYWGEGTGGGRKSFGYIPEIMGDVQFKTSGPHPFEGPVKFKGYKKEAGAPVFFYKAGDVELSLKITPGEAGEAVAEYRSNASSDLKFNLPGNATAQSGKTDNSTLSLTADQAKHFIISYKGAN